jgi:guanine nucleotide-binding protein subunit alpha
MSEFSINSSNGWKSALDRLRNIRHSSSSRNAPESELAESPVTPVKDLGDEAASTLSSVREDIKLLWEDDAVREVLTRRKVRLEDAPGLYVYPQISIQGFDELTLN